MVTMYRFYESIVSLCSEIAVSVAFSRVSLASKARKICHDMCPVFLSRLFLNHKNSLIYGQHATDGTIPA